MYKDQAKRLGAMIRERRLAAGISTHRLGEQIGARNSTVIRLEQGAFAAPSPDKLARIGDALDISLADIYSYAGYAVPEELPSFAAYLPTRYRELPESAVQELVELFNSLVERHRPPSDSDHPKAILEGAP